MTQNPDPTHPKATDEGTEPESFRARALPDDDTEGHVIARDAPDLNPNAQQRVADDGEDDTEGHMAYREAPEVSPTEDTDPNSMVR